MSQKEEEKTDYYVKGFIEGYDTGIARGITKGFEIGDQKESILVRGIKNIVDVPPLDLYTLIDRIRELLKNYEK